jgi:hypothetical protein
MMLETKWCCEKQQQLYQHIGFANMLWGASIYIYLVIICDSVSVIDNRIINRLNEKSRIIGCLPQAMRELLLLRLHQLV